MRVSALEGHRVWAPVYGESNNPVLALERRSMIPFLGPMPPKHVADVACGLGYWLGHFQNAGSAVVGVDLCPEMLHEAAKDLRLRGRLILGDVTLLPLRSQSVDLVICSLTLGYLPCLSKLFAEFARVSKTGARIAVSDLHPTAISAGWTRSFSVGERLYAMEHYGHSLHDIGSAARASGLHAVREESACFGDPEYEIFRMNGKADRFAPLAKIPALYLGMWSKRW
jgi:SAM-dependent methyltransferase